MATSSREESGRGRERVAVVTGAARGLGRADAARLAADGISVVAVDLLDTRETEKAVKSFGVTAVGVKCDISLSADVTRLRELVESKFGHCDILVNNAAAFGEGLRYDKITVEEWEHIQRVNIDGMFLMCQAFTPGMSTSGWGRVINISSNTVGQVMRGVVPYVSSKAAVIGLTRSLASEVGEFGVTVNAILPGLIRTEHGDESVTTRSVSYEDRAKRQAIPRVGIPSDIANVVSFLASEDARFITAQSVVVDGGLLRQ